MPSMFHVGYFVFNTRLPDSLMQYIYDHSTIITEVTGRQIKQTNNQITFFQQFNFFRKVYSKIIQKNCLSNVCLIGDSEVYY